MDQFKERVHKCSEHNQNISFIHVDSNQENVLKCLGCMIAEKINHNQVLPLESINLSQLDQVPNWIHSSEKELNSLYTQYHQCEKEHSIQSYNLRNICENFKKDVMDKINIQQKQFQIQIDDQLSLKQTFVKSYVEFTQLGALQKVISDKGQFPTYKLNEMIRAIIQKATLEAKIAKQNLLNQQNQISTSQFAWNLNRLEGQFSQILEIIKEANDSMNAQKKMKFSTVQNTPDLTNNPFKMNKKKKKIDLNMKQADEEQEQQQRVFVEEQNSEQSMKVTEEIMKLISNKTNGCKDSFLKEVKAQLNNLANSIHLDISDIYQNEGFPLNINNLDDNQFVDLTKLVNDPQQFKINKVKLADCKKNNQSLGGFIVSNYLLPNEIKIIQEKNTNIIKNRQSQGQVVTKSPLCQNNQYSFTIEFNKPFINNLLYFGLIPSNLAQESSISSVSLGFSFSSMSKNQNDPFLMFGPHFNDKSDQTFSLEVKIDLQKKQMYVFSTPDYSTGFYVSLNSLVADNSYHFGIEFQTEQNFIVTVY